MFRQSKSLVVSTIVSVLLVMIITTSLVTCLTNPTYPSQVIDIKNWYMTLPIGEIKDPIDIYHPALSTYSIDPYFMIDPNTNMSVRFRSVIFNESVTTSGSKYPRSELREMDPINPAKVKIAWNNTVGVHTMIIDQAITHLPLTRNRVVAGQIHDDKEFIFTVALAGSTLYINAADKASAKTITKTYQLGQIFRLKIEALNGTTNFYFNDMSTPIYTHYLEYKNSYFKAGCYAQSNCTVEGALCGHEDNYAEVLIYNLTTVHDYSVVTPVIVVNNTNNTNLNNNTNVNNGTVINNGTNLNNNTNINNNTNNSNGTNINNGTNVNNNTNINNNNGTNNGNSTNNNNGTNVDNNNGNNTNNGTTTNSPRPSSSNRGVVVNMSPSSNLTPTSLLNLLIMMILLNVFLIPFISLEENLCNKSLIE